MVAVAQSFEMLSAVLKLFIDLLFIMKTRSCHVAICDMCT